MKLPTEQIEPSGQLIDAHGTYFAGHCERGRFYNPWGRIEPGGVADLAKLVWRPNPWAAQKAQEAPLEPVADALERFGQAAAPKALWIGHASFLVELDGFRALIDPIFGQAGPFVPRQAPNPFSVGDLPAIDAVLLTHGHYDHLDRATLRRLAATQAGPITVITPLGLGHIVPDVFARVVEIDWWNTLGVSGIEISLVPAQHWFRRGVFDTNRALWGGYAIVGSQTLYHAGDSGYFGGFKVIGEVFEDIALAMLPVGAYEPRWFMRSQHMNPEEALIAFDDLGAAEFVGMHWGTFDLTWEPLGRGADRLNELVDLQGRNPAEFHLPRPGGTVSIG